MYLRTLDTEEMRRLYDPCLKRDFPPDELMPWAGMKELIEEGTQRSAGFYEGGSLVAYALFITGSASPVSLTGSGPSAASSTIMR